MRKKKKSQKSGKINHKWAMISDIKFSDLEYNIQK